MFSLNGSRFLMLAGAALLSIVVMDAGQANKIGRYVGELITKWDGDGRHMYLKSNFGFIDAKGAEWQVPKGARVDGASIPKSLWSVIGGPFSGRYRAASVIHDYYCDVQTRPSKAVHKVFHDAMLASGVTTNWAQLMYNAVDWFGPSWEKVRVIEPGCEVLTEDNIDDCAENMVSEKATRARQPSQEELSDFFQAMRAKGLTQEVHELQQRMQ